MPDSSETTRRQKPQPVKIRVESSKLVRQVPRKGEKASPHGVRLSCLCLLRDSGGNCFEVLASHDILLSGSCSCVSSIASQPVPVKGRFRELSACPCLLYATSG